MAALHTDRIAELMHSRKWCVCKLLDRWSCLLLVLLANNMRVTSFSPPSPGSSTGLCRSSLQAANANELKVCSGVRDIVESYDVFLLDMWGVMHDGTKTYDGVHKVVEKLKAADKEMIILSNSSKRKENSVQMLQKLGFDDPLSTFSQIITSGEVAYQLLQAEASGVSPSSNNRLAPKAWAQLTKTHHTRTSKNIFCFGSGAGDADYIRSSGWSLSTIEDADVIVARGTFTLLWGPTGAETLDKNQDGEESYQESCKRILSVAASRRIPMIIANPDKIRPDADRSPMPGMIGSAYHKALLETGLEEQEATNLLKYIGKPFSDVYDIALTGKNRKRACMVGDALETDVTGGARQGIDTVWVIKDGIHNVAVDEKGQGVKMEAGCKAVVDDFNSHSESSYADGLQLHPSVVLPHFVW